MKPIAFAIRVVGEGLARVARSRMPSAFILAFLAAGTVAGEPTVYSNFGPQDSYLVRQDWIVVDLPIAVQYVSQSQPYAKFTVDNTSSSPIAIESIDVPMYKHCEYNFATRLCDDVYNSGSASVVTLELYGDNQGNQALFWAVAPFQ